ncbi:hypothetical protein HHK36_024796 [Tetracentron sinense]|uniref:Homeobox-leucine zipper protein n=1 Tax=Tetracentron sinense TaxID=13715 RepID=A0A835D4Z5_TETSI|nr:hypothetical protein HHK36_024796 [Tetracentron sinense]
MVSGRVYGGSNLAIILQNKEILCSAEDLEALLVSSYSPTFHGSRSMVNFGDVHEKNTPGRSSFQPLDQEENGYEDLDECFHQPEKKRRLTADQVLFLERSFEVENKLEPERKIQLAKDLDLQPRQVAIWFQNRRARWKTKQLEKDYDALKASYNILKADYESHLKEKEKLKIEVLFLTDKLILKEKERGNSETSTPNKPTHLQPQKPIPDSVSEEQVSSMPIVVCKQEDLRSAKDLSQDNEDNLSKSLLPPLYIFPKLEYSEYPDPPANSCHFGFPVEDQAFSLWSY